MSQKKHTLRTHVFPRKFSNKEILNICKRYTRRAFKRKDAGGNISPFCKTHDGIDVEYSFDDNHYTTDDTAQTGFRKLSRLRAERIAWALPIIRGCARGKIYFYNTSNGREYYMPLLEYLVILNIAENRLRLISAYRITIPAKRKEIHGRCHKFTLIKS